MMKNLNMDLRCPRSWLATLLLAAWTASALGCYVGPVMERPAKGKESEVKRSAIDKESEVPRDNVVAKPRASSRQRQVPVDELLRNLPKGERWVKHLRDDLLPFWTMKTALGEPLGEFPTYRCDDGSLYDPGKPCPELEIPSKIKGSVVHLDREYTRARSRQAFAYGIAFQMTGDAEYLKYAKAGVDYLRHSALDRDSGGAVSYFVGDRPEPAAPERTSQDLAYAVTGLAYYYYLTHDPAVLADVLALKDYVFDTYFRDDLGLVTWVVETSPDGESPEQKELVAQLDQVYAYMLWLTPALPEPHQSQWKSDLSRLCHLMIEQFYSPEQNLFWGATTTTASRQLEQPHVDFGHSVKTMWLIYQTGKMIGDLQLVRFAEDRAARILKEAYLEETGSWARRPLLDGTIDPDKEWWILAELDQTAATLALIDPQYARPLPRTYDYWFKHMVDHEHGGVWHLVRASDNEPAHPSDDPDVEGYPKQHSWKNALHTFEHALVGYITAQQLHGQPVKLHYAFATEPTDRVRIQPYFYKGVMKDLTRVSESDDATPSYIVTFTNVR